MNLPMLRSRTKRLFQRMGCAYNAVLPFICVMNKIILSLAAVGILLSGCAIQPEPTPPPVQQGQQQSQKPTPPPALKKIGIYSVFREGVIGNGKPAVLFFYQAAAPDSIATDKAIKGIYSTVTVPVTTYRIDFDKDAAL